VSFRSSPVFRKKETGSYCLGMPGIPGIFGIDIFWYPAGILNKESGTFFSWMFLYSILMGPDELFISVLMGKLSLLEIHIVVVPTDGSRGVKRYFLHL
jgi:hypothetical protein